MATSVFEIIGPIMIGPSSSHTAGMARIGMMAHQIIGGEAVSVALSLSPKLKATYTGHRTDAALHLDKISDFLQKADPYEDYSTMNINPTIEIGSRCV